MLVLLPVGGGIEVELKVGEGDSINVISVFLGFLLVGLIAIEAVVEIKGKRGVEE